MSNKLKSKSVTTYQTNNLSKEPSLKNEVNLQQNFIEPKKITKNNLAKEMFDCMSQQLTHSNNIVWVFCAEDCQISSKIDISANADQCLNSSRPKFELKLIDVEDREQLSWVTKTCLNTINSTSRMNIMFCILISVQMTNFINSDTSESQQFMQLMAHKVLTRDRTVTFALYDELNEINMFRVKFKLTNCIYVLTSKTDLYEDIVNSAVRVYSESLYKSATEKNNLDSGFYGEVSNGKPKFKVFPKQLREGNGKVLVLLEENVCSNRNLVDILLNGKSTINWLKIKWKNAYTLSFKVPDTMLQQSRTLQISIVVDCARFLGTRTVQNENKQTPMHNKLHPMDSIDFMCQVFDTDSIEQIDTKLASSFNESLPDFGIFSYLTQSSKIELWLPTWLHFAATYGFKELVLNLLKSPAAARACFVRNNFDLTPEDLASKHGHTQIVQILSSYTKQMEHIKHDLINLANQNISFSSLLNDMNPTGKNKLAPSEQCLPASDNYYNLQQEKDGHCPAECNTQQFRSASTSFCTATTPNHHKIMEAKNELLDIIEQFKTGISIDSFEKLFRKWEITHEHVLKGQISEEFLHSLNEIKKLCSFSEDCVEEGDEEYESDTEYYYNSCQINNTSTNFWSNSLEKCVTTSDSFSNAVSDRNLSTASTATELSSTSSLYAMQAQSPVNQNDSVPTNVDWPQSDMVSGIRSPSQPTLATPDFLYGQAYLLSEIPHKNSTSPHQQDVQAVVDSNNQVLYSTLHMITGNKGNLNIKAESQPNFVLDGDGHITPTNSAVLFGQDTISTERLLIRPNRHISSVCSDRLTNLSKQNRPPKPLPRLNSKPNKIEAKPQPSGNGHSDNRYQHSLSQKKRTVVVSQPRENIGTNVELTRPTVRLTQANQNQTSNRLTTPTHNVSSLCSDYYLIPKSVPVPAEFFASLVANRKA